MQKRNCTNPVICTIPTFYFCLSKLCSNSSAQLISEAALLFRYFVARYSLMAERHIQIMEYIAL